MAGTEDAGRGGPVTVVVVVVTVGRGDSFFVESKAAVAAAPAAAPPAAIIANVTLDMVGEDIRDSELSEVCRKGGEEASYGIPNSPTGPEAWMARERCLKRVESCLYGSLAAMLSVDGHL
jgi:hypothetical protein